MQNFLFILLGIVTGVLSGIFGIGGGLIMIPAFIYIFGFSQHQAQGTSLAVMLLPVFILAAWQYYAAGNVNVKAALFVAAGLLVGGFAGAYWIQGVQGDMLRKGFGVLLLVAAINMIFFKH
ncbi:MAG: sulfite exporter TauE/SafE family protein [Candidatus Omnitrophica bacterium]|nr:sulfite exporter TauE/SafE family protein [Candidatus Omnitrophota bacterium]